jgi:L-2,4-diaminobutyric acid acetyltransferase
MNDSEVKFAHPTLDDGAAVATLVRETGALEPNTTYAYLLLTQYFGESCLVARRGTELVGCVLGFRIPERPRVLFVWQIGVAPSARGRGLASKILDELVSRPALRDLEGLELTIARSNDASNRLFDSFAARNGWSISRTPGFESHHFGAERHEDELLVTITPTEGK